MKKIISTMLLFALLLGVFSLVGCDLGSMFSTTKPTTDKIETPTQKDTEDEATSPSSDTEKPTESDTQAPTQAPTQSPTQVPTQAPAETATRPVESDKPIESVTTDTTTDIAPKPTESPSTVVPEATEPIDPIDPVDPVVPIEPVEPIEPDKPTHEYLRFETYPYEYGYTVMGVEDNHPADIVVPEEFNGKPVIGIGNSAFCWTEGIKSVTFPESIQFIEWEAFDSCDEITSVYIPKNVSLIRPTAFRNCKSLTKIEVDPENAIYRSSGNCIIDVSKRELVLGCGVSVIPADENLMYIGYMAFNGCETLKNIVIPEGILSTGNNAFSDCTSLESVTLPESLEGIDYKSFAGCTSLKTINIPARVSNIRELAFENCNSLLKQYGDFLYVGQWAIECVSTGNTATFREDTQGIAQYVFDGHDNITKINIFGNVKYIGEDVFDNLTNLQYNISGSIKYLGSEANPYAILVEVVDNDYKYEAKNFTIHKDTKYICERAFFSCHSLNNITIPEGVHTIGAVAFGACFSLGYVYIPASVTFIDYSIVSLCTALPQVVIDEANPSYYSDGNCIVEIDTARVISATANSELPTEFVSSIGRWSMFFGGGSGTFVIPDNIEILLDESVGNSDNGHNKVIMSDNVVYIGTGAFVDCYDMVSIELSNSINRISDHCFAGCVNLRYIEIPYGVLTIGENAFSNCESLQRVVIPSSVKYIDNWAFSDCDSLTTIEYQGTVEEWNNLLKAVAWSDMWDVTCTIVCVDGKVVINAPEEPPVSEEK